MSEVKKPKFDLGEFTQSVVEGFDQPTQVVEEEYDEEHNDVKDIERYDDFIMILPSNITEEGCDLIIEQHMNLPFSEVEETDFQQFQPIDVQDGISYKYEHHNGIDYSVILDGTKEFANIIQVFEHIIPEHPDCDRINFMQVAHYHQDSFFPPHKDIADSNDTATMMIMLNDNYRGGNLHVNGNILANARGTVVSFNNSTQVWHSVDPILEGERFALLVWFGRNDELD